LIYITVVSCNLCAMDNLTHSLVGLALGELVDRALPAASDPARAQTRRRALLVTGLLASNFPDLDLVLTPLLPAPLGYLIHHRGHTHTLLYALPQVALLLGLMWLLWPGARRLLLDDGRARRAVIATALLGMVLHLSFDALNVYGVHPFAPFDARWLYGDLVFIVEPVFWTALGVALSLLRGPRLRWLLLACFAAAPLLFTWLGFLQWGSLALLGAIGVAVGAAHLRWHGRAGLVTACALCLAFVGVQGLAGQQARTQVRAALAQIAPGAQVLDIPLSSFPANPLCWSFATVSENPAQGNYGVRVGVLSLAPGIVPVSSCPARFGGQPGSTEPALAWSFSQTRSLAEFRALQRDNCHFDVWLRFARVPALEQGVATDVRFGAPGAPNFSTLPYAERLHTPCPAPVARWAYPRADLLGWK